MTAELTQPHLVSPEEYLEGELLSPTKHEYLNGLVYATAGAGTDHNRIAMNISIALANRLQGTPCEPFGSDEKVHVQRPGDLRYYYPDVQVVCQAKSSAYGVQECPVVIVEVLSESTRRTDENEKRDAYLTLASLDRYLLVETERPRIVTYARSETGFRREEFLGLAAAIPLKLLNITLPLTEVYARVTFPAPPPPRPA